MNFPSLLRLVALGFVAFVLPQSSRAQNIIMLPAPQAAALYATMDAIIGGAKIIIFEKVRCQFVSAISGEETVCTFKDLSPVWAKPRDFDSTVDTTFVFSAHFMLALITQVRLAVEPDGSVSAQRVECRKVPPTNVPECSITF